MITTAEKLEKLKDAIANANSMLVQQANKLRDMEDELTAIRAEMLSKPPDQDRLDAARYRKLKEIFRKTGRMWVFNPLEWDGELDKISGEREHERETKILGGPVPPVDHDITEP